MNIPLEQKCANCCFLNENNTCKLGQLETFSKLTKIRKDDNDKPVIENRKCPTFRPKRWANALAGNDLEIVVRSEILIKPEVILYLDNTVYYYLDKMKQLVESLNEQLLTPLMFTVIHNYADVNFIEYRKILMSNVKNYIWKLDKPISGKSKYDCLDLRVEQTESKYIFISNGHPITNKDFFANFDEYINVKLNQCIALFTKYGSFYHIDLLNTFGGFYPIEVKEFKTWFSEEQLDKVELPEKNISFEDKLYFIAKINREEGLIKYDDLEN